MATDSEHVGVPRPDEGDQQVCLRDLIRDALSTTNSQDEVLNEDPAPLGGGSSSSPPARPSSVSGVDVNTGMLMTKVIGVDQEMVERRSIHAEIFGRESAEIELMEQRLADLEYEIWQLPPEEKAALARVIVKNPLLFTVSSHTKLFLRSEDFDAKLAARRMANYWAKREVLFGEAGAIMDGDVRDANLEDYIRFFVRSETVMDSPDADDVSKEIARAHIDLVRRAKITAMDKCIVESLSNSIGLFSSLKECGIVRHNSRNESVIGGSDEHKMKFVRSEGFVEQRAAGRRMKYWGKKLELFGPELASKSITLDDMADDWDGLELGFLRIMPGADKYGRMVAVFTAKALNDLDESRERGIVKATWYILSAALEQKNCQRNGIVFVANLRGANPSYLLRRAFRSEIRETTLNCMPMQVKAIHVLLPPSRSWWQSIIYTVFSHTGKIQSIPSILHKLVVVHAGGSTEQELSDFAACGISRDQLPCELGGNVTLESYKEWLAERKSNGL